MLLACCESARTKWWKTEEFATCKKPEVPSIKSGFLNWRKIMVVYGLVQENYGKADTDCVARVKELYKALNLEVLLPALL